MYVVFLPSGHSDVDQMASREKSTITLSRDRTVYVRLCLSSGIGDEEEPSYLKRDLPADYCCCSNNCCAAS